MSEYCWRMCVFGGAGVKWGVPNFLSFSINADVMRVYAVSGDGLVLLCFWWFVFLYVLW
jgi:hypothetical protein